MHFSTRFVSLALLVCGIAVDGAEVLFRTERSCDIPASLDYRNVACNTCVDPPEDWYGAEVRDIGSGQRWEVHNQNGCTAKSLVGQFYGPLCSVAGHTAIRSVYVAC
ncbi:hypothetical protein PLICRDRAFT_152334 [Plicaturopsis crispa FD-325 SS-3]|nr:hypothetical protein PLICRDRAFT_152334 [Plicaturopsis crispa FD-325 SS-3]